VALYEGAAREAVHALKFANRYGIAPMMAHLLAQTAVRAGADVIVPIPLHKKRRRERGYDQAVLLAQHLGRHLGVPSDPGTLLRVRATRQQALLPASERQPNVAGAFEVQRRLDGARLLLVDDVSTTGATIEAAARTLKSAGAPSVCGIVFARAV